MSEFVNTFEGTPVTPTNKFKMRPLFSWDVVLCCSRVPAANAPECTAAQGLLYKPWSLVIPTFLLAPPGVSARDPSSERWNYLDEKWLMNFA